jgi:hypothetical protein
MPKPKTLKDFPEFRVSAIRRGRTSEEGYTRFELDGKFERIVGEIDPHWFWLLFGEKDCICATMQSLDNETRAVVLTCDLKDEPKVAGQTLAYLSPYWQAYHVWMVLDPAGAGRSRYFMVPMRSPGITTQKRLQSLMAAKCGFGQSWNSPKGERVRVGTIQRPIRACLPTLNVS